jgi:hypothetical protein
MLLLSIQDLRVARIEVGLANNRKQFSVVPTRSTTRGMAKCDGRAFSIIDSVTNELRALLCRTGPDTPMPRVDR